MVIQSDSASVPLPAGRARRAHVLAALVLAVIFAIDLLTPLGLVVGVLYILPLLMAVELRDRQLLYITAIVAVVLTIVALVIGHNEPSWMVYANRALSVTCIGVCCFLIDRSMDGAIALEAHKREIQVERDKYRSIMAVAQEGIVVADSSSTITDWNAGAERMLGWSRDQMLGQKLSAIMPERFRAAHTAGMARYLESGVPKLIGGVVEVPALCSDGSEIAIELSLATWVQGEQHYFLGILRNIEERKQAEREREQYNLTVQQKNEEMEQFVYIASHDLQEPLRTVSSFAELLQEEYSGQLDSDADTYLKFISQGALRMSALIRGLLEYSALGQTQDVTTIDCNVVLDEVLHDLGVAIREAKAKIDVGDLPTFRAQVSHAEFRLLLQNLISNAIKFRKPDKAPIINISVEPTADGWQFVVCDNGIGIEEIYQDNIFRIFQRLHSSFVYEGSGIGLSHCKKIVEMLGGRLWVESEPGGGSCFFFTVKAEHSSQFL